MVRVRRPRLAWFRLGLVVFGILAIGLVVGVFLDSRLETRPIATVLCAVFAAQLAVLVVYREFVAWLRQIADHAAQPNESEPAKRSM